MTELQLRDLSESLDRRARVWCFAFGGCIACGAKFPEGKYGMAFEKQRWLTEHWAGTC